MSRPRPLFAAAAAAVAIGAAAGPATAQPKKVAVVALEIGGDGAPELRPQLAESVAKGVRASGVATVELAAVLAALEPSPELVGCFSSTCLDRIGDKVKADGFVRGRVAADGADYTLELELYDRDQLVHRLELPCAVCTIAELNTLAEKTAQRLIVEARERPVSLVIRTEPSGAELTIDGLKRGAAPFEGPLPRGSHEVVAEVPGVGRIARRVEVTEKSGAEPIVIAIPGASIPDPDGSAGGSALGIGKWITAGASVAALGLGGVLLAIDGRPTCDDSRRECPDELDTAVAGWVSLGVGAAAGLAAGWMFYADRNERDRRVSISPTPGGAAASLSFDW